MPDKLHEMRQLELLRRVLPDFPVGLLEWQETPDCIVRGESKKIGIELTTYHHTPPLGERSFTEVRSLTSWIVELAHRKFMDAGGPPLYVNVHFRNEPPVSKSNAQSIADALASAIQQTNKPLCIDEGRMPVPWELLPEEIASVGVAASVDGKDRLWSAGAGAWQIPLQAADVQAIVERKSKMHAKARAKCEEVWLVIATDMWRAAPVEFSDSVAEQVFSGPFDRAIWFEPHMLGAWILGTATVFRAKGHWEQP
jgi:hypothetical protein